MKFRELKGTGLKVSPVSLGTWVFSGEPWGEADDIDSINVVREAVDRGVNFIDTAPVYGEGRAENVIGKAVKGLREKVFIATKCGLKIAGKSMKIDLSPESIREDIEMSLKRLGVETIDLYQCHWPDKNTPIEATIAEMKKLVSEGKVRHVGVSNFNSILMEEAVKILPGVTEQVRYSVFDREIEREILPVCIGRNISILAYGSLGGGILSGKYKSQPVFSRSDVRSFFYKYYSHTLWDKYSKMVSVIDGVAKNRGCASSEVAINWVLNHGEVATCIVGCRDQHQLRENLDSLNWSLTETELGVIEEAYKKIFVF